MKKDLDQTQIYSVLKINVSERQKQSFPLK
jgi:hypothetical protein